MKKFATTLVAVLALTACAGTRPPGFVYAPRLAPTFDVLLPEYEALLDEEVQEGDMTLQGRATRQTSIDLLRSILDEAMSQADPITTTTEDDQ